VTDPRPEHLAIGDILAGAIVVRATAWAAVTLLDLVYNGEAALFAERKMRSQRSFPLCLD
jgi:hypothetical protein